MREAGSFLPGGARRVAGEIQEFIRREGIAPGGRLPTEVALAKRFGVSRSILREAIQALKTLGVVESRPRVGLRVLPFDPRSHIDPMISRIRTDDERRELYEFRCLIEPLILGLVARRAAPRDLDALEHLLRSPFPLRDDPVEDGLARDVAFHEGLWKLSGNRFLYSLRGLLVQYFADIQAARTVSLAEIRRTHEQHLSIVRALKAGNLERARRELARNLRMFGTNGDGK